MLLILTLFSLVSCQGIQKDLTSHPNWRLIDRGDNCGHSVSDRIIGGELASLGQYPWIARLGYMYELLPGYSMGPIFDCGGAIINNMYILTAAHCNSQESGVLQLKTVRFGEHNVKTDVDCSNGVCALPVQDIDIEEYICHKDYDPHSHQNDICLVRLAKPIQFNDYVQPICLPVYNTLRDDDFVGSVMEVAGWGIVDIKTEAKSDILLTLKIPVIKHQICAALYRRKTTITTNQICAGGVIGKDSCGGDSGGPLVKAFSMKAPPRYFVIGIVSFGNGKCATSEDPGVYTKVSSYLTWILDNIRE